MHCSTFKGLKKRLDQVMERAIHEATEESLLEEPLLSEMLKHFIQEQPRLIECASDKFDDLLKSRKMDEATAVMLQFGKSVTAKQNASAGSKSCLQEFASRHCVCFNVATATIP